MNGNVSGVGWGMNTFGYFVRAVTVRMLGNKFTRGPRFKSAFLFNESVMTILSSRGRNCLFLFRNEKEVRYLNE